MGERRIGRVGEVRERGELGAPGVGCDCTLSVFTCSPVLLLHTLMWQSGVVADTR